ncbi:MAG: Alanine--tRNA ligase [Methanonatronarchaeales archaeon]|nr:Alanine--tRNA ligase [Methanonatronarchaeales archaeon]
MSLEEEYRVDYLVDLGFERRRCRSCGSTFWTLDAGRESCGDPPCDLYSFIGEAPLSREYGLSEMRETFLSFFEDRGHERLDRRPVAAWWRDDLYLTVASIADFQPHVTSGRVPPPANPLTISQPCIRLDDLDSVGRSGRHLSSFEMMAHHAFNFNDEVYWKERTVELCQELLTGLGVHGEEVIYKEDPWAGGGNAGPAFEVLVRGLELATLVFMDLEEHPEGEYGVKGSRYRRMDARIVDTGYGLERFTWASKGSPTVYDAAFPGVVEELTGMAGLEHRLDDPEYREVLGRTARLAGYMDVDTAGDLMKLRRRVAGEMDVDAEHLDEMLRPVEGVYAVADHARSLAFMLGDGLVPSNVGAGYLVRLVARRAIRFMNQLGVDASLADAVKLQTRLLGEDYPEFLRAEEEILEMCDSEEAKFEDTLSRGKNLIVKTADHFEGEVPVEALVDLYDSHGLPPEYVDEVAEEQGYDVEVPDDFYARVAAKHEGPGEGGAGLLAHFQERLEDLPDTDRLYYELPGERSFEAVVLNAFEDHVVLDQTLFYPEGGGQPPDRGTLETGEGVFDVAEVKSVNGVILHRIREGEGLPKKGEIVTGRIDGELRDTHSRHHTSIHLVLSAAAEVLGSHVRQHGSQVGAEKARVDVTHFKSITREEVNAIEARANGYVREDAQVRPRWTERNEAEEKFGLEIYQGGVPHGDQIRVLDIEGVDVQACGGTHVSSTGSIGLVYLDRVDQVQDGVYRLGFSSGEVGVERMQESRRTLLEAAETLDVDPDDLPRSVERFFDEWKGRGKEIRRLREEVAELRRDDLVDGAEEIGGAEVVIKELTGADMNELRATAESLLEAVDVALLGGGNGVASVVAAVSDGVDVDASELVEAACGVLGGGGGGSRSLAQGGGPNAESLGEALSAARELLEDGPS